VYAQRLSPRKRVSERVPTGKKFFLVAEKRAQREQALYGEFSAVCPSIFLPPPNASFRRTYVRPPFAVGGRTVQVIMSLLLASAFSTDRLQNVMSRRYRRYPLADAFYCTSENQRFGNYANIVTPPAVTAAQWHVSGRENDQIRQTNEEWARASAHHGRRRGAIRVAA